MFSQNPIKNANSIATFWGWVGGGAPGQAYNRKLPRFTNALTDKHTDRQSQGEMNALADQHIWIEESTDRNRNTKRDIQSQWHTLAFFSNWVSGRKTSLAALISSQRHFKLQLQTLTYNFNLKLQTSTSIFNYILHLQTSNFKQLQSSTSYFTFKL